MQQAKTVAILYLNTGGGHIGYARALEKGIKRKYPHTNVVLFNPLTDSLFLKMIIEEGFSITTKNDYTAYIFKGLSHLWNSEFPRRTSEKIFLFSLRKTLHQFFSQQKFDYIISTHFFLSRGVMDELQEYHWQSAFFHLVADPFSPHPIRFDMKGCTYLVGSEQVKKMCLQRAIPEESIRVFPMILDEKFSQQLSETEKKAVRKEFAIKKTEKVVLVLWGGEGIPNGNKILSALLSYQFFSPHLKFFIICGKNQQLYHSFQKCLSGHPQAHRFQIYWYIYHMYELINIADIVLCKAGPATVFEVLSQGKPMIIYKKFWHHEKGNVDFVVQNQCGLYEPRIDFLPWLIDGILLNTKMQMKLKEHIKRLQYQNGLDACIEYIFSC